MKIIMNTFTGSVLYCTALKANQRDFTNPDEKKMERTLMITCLSYILLVKEEMDNTNAAFEVTRRLSDL